MNVPSSQFQCCCWVGGLSGDAPSFPPPSPLLVYISLFLDYNKWTCSIRLSPVVHAAAKHCHLTPLLVAGVCWQETPERPLGRYPNIRQKDHERFKRGARNFPS